MLKLIGGGLLFLIMAYIGILIKRHYKQRYEFYSDCRQFFEEYSRDVSVNKTPLKIAVKTANIEQSHPFGTILKRIGEALDSGSDISSVALNKREKLLLKGNESARLLTAFSDTGKCSWPEEVARLNSLKDEYAKMSDKCGDEFKRLGGMYFKLFVILGLAAMLVVQ